MRSWAHLFPLPGLHYFLPELSRGKCFLLDREVPGGLHQARCFSALYCPVTALSVVWCLLDRREKQPVPEISAEPPSATPEVHDIKQKPVLSHPMQDLEGLLLLPTPFQLFFAVLLPQSSTPTLCTHAQHRLHDYTYRVVGCLSFKV